MKTLVYKNNPQLRITAPEIIEEEEYYTLDGETVFLKEYWTLVEEEPVDLEQAAKKIAYDVCKDLPKGEEKDGIVYYSILAAKAGAEWQKKQDELTWEDIKRIIQIADSMLTGTAWDAVDYPDEQKYYEQVLEKYKEEKK